jgi:hypothetical protein
MLKKCAFPFKLKYVFIAIICRTEAKINNPQEKEEYVKYTTKMMEKLFFGERKRGELNKTHLVIGFIAVKSHKGNKIMASIMLICGNNGLDEQEDSPIEPEFSFKTGTTNGEKRKTLKNL